MRALGLLALLSTHLKGHRETGQAAEVLSRAFKRKQCLESRAAPSAHGDDRVPQSAKSLAFSASEQRVNFVITLLMFFSRRSKNRKKSG